MRAATGPIPLTATSVDLTMLDLVVRDLTEAGVPFQRVDTIEADELVDSLAGLMAAAPFTLALLLQDVRPHPSFIATIQKSLQMRLTPVFLVGDPAAPLPYAIADRLDELDIEAPRLSRRLLEGPGALIAALAQTSKHLLASRQVFCGTCMDWAKFDRFLESAD